MKSKSIILYLVLITCDLCAQNLIPNGSFEVNTGCPGGSGAIWLATPWNNPPNHSGSSDYFHVCATNLGYTVPTNFNGMGYQVPKTGSAYAGFVAVYYSAGNFREYLHVQLSDTLVKCEKYLFKMYLSSQNLNKYIIDAIGVFFSDTVIKGGGNSGPIIVVPQITNTKGNFLGDTLNWMLVSGIYYAQGGEKYIAIGNFNDNANTDTIPTGVTVNNTAIYYYVDDVSLEQIFDLKADGDTSICIGDSILLSACGDTLFEWYNAVNPAVMIASGKSIYVKPIVTTEYIVKGTDGAIDSVMVQVRTLPLVSLVNDTTVCDGETVKLDAGSNNISSYMWTTGETTQTIRVFSKGQYGVTVSNECGIASDAVEVFNKEDSFMISVPNIFTPNKDNLNETFNVVSNVTLSNFSLKIFNRWGQNIFNSEDIKIQWDGTYLGAKMPDGIYYWLLTYNTECSDAIVVKNGFLTLIR